MHSRFEIPFSDRQKNRCDEHRFFIKSQHQKTTLDRKMNWHHRIPKVELHLHLEGAIPYPTLWQLIQKYGGDPSVPNLEALTNRFQYRNFLHFLETWSWKNQFIREYADFTCIAEAVAQDLARQNIRYAEAFYSPSDFAPLETQGITEAIRKGLNRISEIEVALVADLVRNNSPAQAGTILKEVHEVRSCGVIGIGIGGSEHKFPPEPFESVYEDARSLGFQTSVHAGEAAGAESIWGAIRSLRADRIGHGTRANEDERLLDHLSEHQIPLEMCPISNVRTGVVPSYEDHPVRQYVERGIPISINTDDPKMFGNSLAEEFQMLEDRLHFSRDDIRALILQSIRTSWLCNEKKQKLICEFSQDPNWSAPDTKN